MSRPHFSDPAPELPQPESAAPAYHATFISSFEPDGQTLKVSADQPLLQSAENAGLRPESSCRNGTCRSCICQLLSGHVSYRIAWPGLSPDEKLDGYILPCVAYPASDVVLRLAV